VWEQNKNTLTKPPKPKIVFCVFFWRFHEEKSSSSNTTQNLFFFHFFLCCFRSPPVCVHGVVVSIIGFVCRFVLLHNKLAVSAVIISFRQAFVIALLLALTLFLLAHQLFSWLNMSLLIIGFTVLEFILISLSLHHDE
jgi:hypothetical protein